MVLLPNKNNHLKKESLIRTDKIATIDCSLIIGKIGVLSDDENQQLNIKLKLLLKL
jgi:mRNA interferase MazF